MITKGFVLLHHAKSSEFVEPNAEGVNFVGTSAIAFALPFPIVGSIKRSEGNWKFQINLLNFHFVRVIQNELRHFEFSCFPFITFQSNA